MPNQESRTLREAIMADADGLWLIQVVDEQLIELGDRLSRIVRDNHIAAHMEPTLRREALAANLSFALMELFKMRDHLSAAIQEARAVVELPPGVLERFEEAMKANKGSGEP